MASKNMLAPVDDLYADVVDLPIPEPVDRSERPQSLVERVQDLETLNQKLKHQNKVLKRNIGTLFRTATSELDRKDRQIVELREQVSKSRKVGSKPIDEDGTGQEKEHAGQDASDGMSVVIEKDSKLQHQKVAAKTT